MNWTRLAAALDAAPEVSEWAMRVHHRRGAQIYLIGEQTESRRSVETEQASVDIHVDHDGGRGVSSFAVLPGELDGVGGKIAEAVFMARLGKNPPFRLPAPAASYPEVEIADPAIVADAPRVVEEIAANVLRGLQVVSGVRPSSIEVFAEDVTTQLRTSAGVQAEKHGTTLLLELVAISTGRDGRETERQVIREWRRAADLDAGPWVREQAQYARDALEAHLPRAGVFPVVVRGGDLPELFEPFLFHSAASTRFRQMGRFQIGDQVTESDGGEPLEIISDATLPFGLKSQPFDGEGLPGTRVTLVADSNLQAFWAPNRYAQYLGVPPTGEAANLVVASGTRDIAALLAVGPVIEVVSFSALDPDPFTGDFVGEIRLGYLHEGGRRAPLKGGSVSGNVFQAFGTAHFSRERAVHGAYEGPAAIRFEGLQIAGE